MFMPEFPVSPQKVSALYEKMSKLGIKESEIKESFIRSSGKGGQNVNRRATCVYLKHIPTGTEVKCMKTRSQGLNRFLARRILVDKIEQMILGEKSAEQKRIEKIRRQKRKRSKRTKEKMLREKKIQREKKQIFSKIT